MIPNDLNRRDFLHRAGLALGGALALGGGVVPPSRMTRPNVLVLLTDDQQYNTIAAAGNAAIRTPHLDRLLREGTACECACHMGSMNAAVCIASRAMILTGRSLFRLRGDGRVIPPEHVTLPETFRRSGYHTVHVGKWHQDKASFARSFSGGDAIHFSGSSDHYAVDVRPFDPTGVYADKDVKIVRGRHSTEIFCDAALAFLRSADAQQPFFAYVAFTAPHDPRTAPQDFRALYNPDTLSLPPNFMPEHPFDNGESQVRDELLAPRPRTPEAARAHLADYYAILSHLDHHVGRILNCLDETGLSDNTIVVFTSDNGIALGQHGLMGKQNLYEHSLRVPLILRGPGIPAGRCTSQRVFLFDLFSTLCTWTGLDIPESVDGRVIEIGKEGPAEGREAMLFAYKHFQRAIRVGPWKVIKYNVQGTSHTQLFNLDEDRWEQFDLATSPECKNTLEALEFAMAEAGREYGDPADIRKSGWGVAEIPAWSPGP